MINGHRDDRGVLHHQFVRHFVAIHRHSFDCVVLLVAPEQQATLRCERNAFGLLIGQQSNQRDIGARVVGGLDSIRSACDVVDFSGYPVDRKLFGRSDLVSEQIVCLSAVVDVNDWEGFLGEISWSTGFFRGSKPNYEPMLTVYRWVLIADPKKQTVPVGIVKIFDLIFRR